MGLDDTTAISIGAFRVWEEGPPVEHFDRKDPWAQRIIVVPWEQRVAFCKYMIGDTVNIGGVVVSGSTVSYPDAEDLYVDSLDLIDALPGDGVMPHDGPNGMIAYKYARYRVTYKSLDLQVDNQDISTTGIEFGSDIITLPRDTLKFVDGTPVAIGRPIVVPVVTLVKTRRRLTSLPVSTLINLSQNPLNSASFEGAGAGYVMFDGGRAFRRTTLSGTTYDVEYRHLARGIPWDYDLRPDGSFGKVVRQDGSPLYGSSDHNALYT